MLTPSDNFDDLSSMKAEDYEHYEDDLWNLEEQDKRKYSEINGTGLKRKQDER